MIYFVYLISSVIVFLMAALLHAFSYIREMPKSYLTALWFAAAILCIPLVLLFVRLKKENTYQEVWHPFWTKVIERCPRWIWASTSIAWLLAMFSFGRSIF